MLPSQKEVTLESLVRQLNEKLDSVLCESNAKDDLVANHAKTAQEAIAGDYCIFIYVNTYCYIFLRHFLLLFNVIDTH